MIHSFFHSRQYLHMLENFDEVRHQENTYLEVNGIESTFYLATSKVYFELDYLL